MELKVKDVQWAAQAHPSSRTAQRLRRAGAASSSWMLESVPEEDFAPHRSGAFVTSGVRWKEARAEIDAGTVRPLPELPFEATCGPLGVEGSVVGLLFTAASTHIVEAVLFEARGSAPTDAQRSTPPPRKKIKRPPYTEAETALLCTHAEDTGWARPVQIVQDFNRDPRSSAYPLRNNKARENRVRRLTPTAEENALLCEKGDLSGWGSPAAIVTLFQADPRSGAFPRRTHAALLTRLTTFQVGAR